MTLEEDDDEPNCPSRNSICLFQDALKSISPPPEEPDLTEAIKSVLSVNNDQQLL